MTVPNKNKLMEYLENNSSLEEVRSNYLREVFREFNKEDLTTEQIEFQGGINTLLKTTILQELVKKYYSYSQAIEGLNKIFNNYPRSDKDEISNYLEELASSNQWAYLEEFSNSTIEQFKKELGQIDLSKDDPNHFLIYFLTKYNNLNQQKFISQITTGSNPWLINQYNKLNEVLEQFTQNLPKSKDENLTLKKPDTTSLDMLKEEKEKYKNSLIVKLHNNDVSFIEEELETVKKEFLNEHINQNPKPKILGEYEIKAEVKNLSEGKERSYAVYLFNDKETFKRYSTQQIPWKEQDKFIVYTAKKEISQEWELDIFDLKGKSGHLAIALRKPDAKIEFTNQLIWSEGIEYTSTEDPISSGTETSGTGTSPTSGNKIELKINSDYVRVGDEVEYQIHCEYPDSEIGSAKFSIKSNGMDLVEPHFLNDDKSFNKIVTMEKIGQFKIIPYLHLNNQKLIPGEEVELTVSANRSAVNKTSQNPVDDEDVNWDDTSSDLGDSNPSIPPINETTTLKIPELTPESLTHEIEINPETNKIELRRDLIELLHKRIIKLYGQPLNEKNKSLDGESSLEIIDQTELNKLPEKTAFLAVRAFDVNNKKYISYSYTVIAIPPDLTKKALPPPVNQYSSPSSYKSSDEQPLFIKEIGNQFEVRINPKYFPYLKGETWTLHRNSEGIEQGTLTNSTFKVPINLNNRLENNFQIVIRTNADNYISNMVTIINKEKKALEEIKLNAKIDKNKLTINPNIDLNLIEKNLITLYGIPYNTQTTKQGELIPITHKIEQLQNLPSFDAIQIYLYDKYNNPIPVGEPLTLQKALPPPSKGNIIRGIKIEDVDKRRESLRVKITKDFSELKGEHWNLYLNDTLVNDGRVGNHYIFNIPIELKYEQNKFQIKMYANGKNYDSNPITLLKEEKLTKAEMQLTNPNKQQIFLEERKDSFKVIINPSYFGKLNGYSWFLLKNGEEFSKGILEESSFIVPYTLETGSNDFRLLLKYQKGIYFSNAVLIYKNSKEDELIEEKEQELAKIINTDLTITTGIEEQVKKSESEISSATKTFEISQDLEKVKKTLEAASKRYSKQLEKIEKQRDSLVQEISKHEEKRYTEITQELKKTNPSINDDYALMQKYRVLLQEIQLNHENNKPTLNEIIKNLKSAIAIIKGKETPENKKNWVISLLNSLEQTGERKIELDNQLKQLESKKINLIKQLKKEYPDHKKHYNW